MCPRSERIRQRASSPGPQPVDGVMVMIVLRTLLSMTGLFGLPSEESPSGSEVGIEAVLVDEGVDDDETLESQDVEEDPAPFSTVPS